MSGCDSEGPWTKRDAEMLQVAWTGNVLSLMIGSGVELMLCLLSFEANVKC
jgi:hypothetical protein